MKKTYLQKGFTLIELLVVISIIGLLSTIVLASLSTARVNAADASIKSALTSIKATSEVEYGSLRNSYAIASSDVTLPMEGIPCSTLTGYRVGTTFLRDQKVQDSLLKAKELSGSDGMCNVSADGKSFAIAFPLKTPGKYFCVDSSGTGKVLSQVSDSSLNLAQLQGLGSGSSGGGFTIYKLNNWCLGTKDSNGVTQVSSGPCSDGNKSFPPTVLTPSSTQCGK